ncbi:MAG TPA: mannosyltransferase family protein [bacterium]|nr:mannosyltransferase family protein [bacterium]
MLDRFTNAITSEWATRLALALSYVVMAVLALSLVAAILLHGSASENALIAYLTPRYYRLVWGLFASVVTAAFLATRLDAARRKEKPFHAIAADWVRSAWSWLALRSPLCLRLPIIACLMAAFAFFIPSQENARITYASPDVPAPIAGSPQLIAESRGAGVSGYSRWRLGDQVFYVRSSGFGLGIISPQTGRIIWQGSLTHETADDGLMFSEVLAGIPDDIVTVVVAHDFSSAFLSKEFHTLLTEMGCSIEENPVWNGGHILISARRDGRFSPVAELWGKHAVLALDPNPVMRLYFLFRRVLPEINTIALIAILVLLMAAFARGNHDTEWPRAFRIGLIGGPILGIAVLWLLHSRAFLIVSASLAILVGTYLWYRDAFLNRKKLAYKIIVAAIALVALCYPDFLARNYAFVRLLTLSVALYLAWKAYSLLFGGSRLVSYSLFVFFATRIPLALIAYISRLYFHGAPKSLRELLVHWDAAFYVDIAQAGYEFSHPGGTPAFYPLYPFLIRALHILFGNMTISGIVVSNLAFPVALCLLYNLAAKKWGEDVARRSVFLLAVGPVSFFFSAIYTESIFLLFCLAFFSLAGSRKWLAAGICGILALLTRSVGIILVPVGLWEYAKHIRFNPRRLRLDVAYLLMIPLGLVLFGFVQYAQTGDMFASVSAQRAWERYPMQNPISVLIRDWKTFDLNISVQYFNKLQVTIADGACIVAAFLVLILIVPIGRQLGIPAAIFVSMGALLPLSTGTPNSMLRYAHVLFPIFIWLGIKTSKERVFMALAAAFLMILVFFTILHFNGILMT